MDVKKCDKCGGIYRTDEIAGYEHRPAVRYQLVRHMGARLIPFAGDRGPVSISLDFCSLECLRAGLDRSEG
jgi:hypothetical protein